MLKDHPDLVKGIEGKIREAFKLNLAKSSSVKETEEVEEDE
ncbi:hypothetical protein SDC9_200043 [bioreactor metagenome]|uniref:Uncharacterized protein n=1 Tax=bioreactor metagenome TaxID=1076179 RepID=A0A645INE7_9ZZZZ